MVRISELDVHDDGALREAWEVEQAAQGAERSDPLPRPYSQLEQILRRPGPYSRQTLVVAEEGARIVGVGVLSSSLRENLHLAEVDVNVLPEARRRGIGRALLADLVERGRALGRTTYLGEAHQPTVDDVSPGSAFALALGFGVAHREEHLVLTLPPDETSLPAGRPEGYDVVTWTSHCPDELVTEYAVLLTQMRRDAPSGDVDAVPTVVDVERVRTQEHRNATAYDQVVAAARRKADGRLGGYTLVYLAHDTDQVLQDDTFVLSDHRGQGLGVAMKAAMLRLLARDRPERRTVHTWNALDNEPMQAVNARLGFRPVEVLLEMQRKVPHA
jgi:GNAT superfamily N-acetyltransferase